MVNRVPLALGNDGLPQNLQASDSLIGGALAAGPHLLGLPNGNFEDAVGTPGVAGSYPRGWTTAVTGTGSTILDATAGNQVTGQNSVKMVTAAAGDTSSLTGALFPCGGLGFPVSIQARAKSSGSAGRLVTQVSWFDRTKTVIGSAVTLNATTGLPTSFAEYGATIVPPAGTCYGQVTIRLDTAADTVWVDEVLGVREGDFDFDLRRFGAVGDGATDDSVALQRALAFIARKGGGRLHLRAPHYLNPTTATTFVIPASVEACYDPLGRFKLGAKATLSHPGRINAGATWIFDITTVSGGVVTTTTGTLPGPVLPEWWGAVGDGATDDTVAIQAAVNFCAAAGGGTTLFRDRNYLISAAILMIPNNLRLSGAGGTSTTIVCNNATQHGVQMGNPSASTTGSTRNCEVRDLQVTAAQGSKTNGAGILMANTYQCVVRECVISAQQIALQMYATSFSLIDHNYLTNNNASGSYLQMSNGCVADIIRDNNLDGAIICTNGVYISTGCNGFEFRNNNVADCINGLNISNANPAVQNGFFSQNAWDSCTGDGIVMQTSSNSEYIGRMNFVGEWSASNNGRGVALAASAGTISGVQFTGPEIFGNGKDGIFMSGNVIDVSVSNPAIAGNSNPSPNGHSNPSPSTAGSYHGIDIQSGVTHITIGTGRSRPWGGAANTQAYGVVYQAGSGPYLQTNGMDLSGNLTGAYLNNATASQCTFVNCLT